MNRDVDGGAAARDIAIIGAGPGGFYTAEALLRALPDCRVHLIERLAAPHGLVRYGVAPDHQKLKQIGAVFDGIAGDPRLSLHAGVRVGESVSLDDLRACSRAVVLATGCAIGRPTGVTGEGLAQVFSSAAFVGWYNGHPDHVRLAPNLEVEHACVIGHGNVALDVCRLLVRAYDDLKVTDIPEPMLRRFERRRVREVHLLGRGGPGSVKFTFKEFRQLVDLPNVRVRLPQAESWTDAHWTPPVGASPDAVRVLQWLRHHASAATADADAPGTVTVTIWFHVVPDSFVGDRQVQTLLLRTTDTSGAVPDRLPCEIAVTCVGYTFERMAGVPFYTDGGAVRHREGQVLDAHGVEAAGLFVAGWAKRGPNGIVGTNRADGLETAATIVARWDGLEARGHAGVTEWLTRSSIAPLTHADWLTLNSVERAHGERLGKPREKVLSVEAAVRALREARRDAA